MKKKIFNFIRIFVSLALMAFLIYRNRGNFGNILDTLRTLDARFLIIAVVLYFIGISFIVFRWGTLLKAHGYNISRPFLWQSAFIGWFYNMLLPTSIGGDFYRVHDLYKNKKVPMNENISAVVMERIIGTISGITLLVI
ncbi:MAG: flippase-like domain-containing protein [Actinobacteria bacterium]|nr:flippase-like domain-containing protein [Actinomycetota bacterium]